MKKVKRQKAQLDADILVVGAGLAGLTAAFDLAETGRRVLLVDRSGAHGGTMTLLDQQFPTDSCGFCQILPRNPQEAGACLKALLDHPGVAFLPFTTVRGAEGKAGDFVVELRRQATGVDPNRCTRCGLCIESCPEAYPDPVHGGMTDRKAIGFRAPLCTPSELSVDWEQCSRCGQCVKACPEEAVNLDAKDTKEICHVRAIILATGFSLHDPSDIAEYGYGRHQGVMTTLELERLMAKSVQRGQGAIRKPSNGRQPSRIAWIQCVGSRDEKRDYCSSVCCMVSLKEARLLRGLLPESHLEIFYMDLRTCGKGYETYLNQARDMGINLTRARPAEVFEKDGQLLLQLEGTDGTFREEPFDLVVLSVGFEASPETRRLADLLGCNIDANGFFQPVPGSLSRTNREGVYVAGAAAIPSDIPESVVQAHEAAALAASHAEPSSQPDSSGDFFVTDFGEVDPRILVALCNCSETLTSSLDFESLRAHLEKEPNVTGARLYSHLCHQKEIQDLSQELDECEANTLVVGACTPRWLGPRLRQIFSFPGLDPNLVRMVNLREQGVWAHGEIRPGLKERVLAQLQAALAMCREYRSHPKLAARDTHPEILIVGGGPAGMSAALSLWDLGVPVTLVEREAELGGNLRWIQYGLDPQFRPDKLREDLIKSMKTASAGIKTFTKTMVRNIQGRPGAFQATLTGPDGCEEVHPFGAIILATGGHVHKPKTFLYGEDPRILNQRDLELTLSGQSLDPRTLREVIMIQCAGSRDEEHPYCSRVCCAAALKNALRLLEANPDLRLIILYRDIRSFGTMERYYGKARELGALFIPFETSDPPELGIQDQTLVLETYDPLVGLRVRFNPDRVILSTGIVPETPVQLLSDLGLKAGSEGFMPEANSKFRPLDLQEGVYACGLALGPAFLTEAMAQGRGAALKAAAFLESMKRPETFTGVWVKEARCSACGLCVAACPYDARELDDEQDYAIVHSNLCQACGTCTAVCPNDASQLQGGTNRQILSAIDAMFE